jgi:hypothetical protein
MIGQDCFIKSDKATFFYESADEAGCRILEIVQGAKKGETYPKSEPRANTVISAASIIFEIFCARVRAPKDGTVN